ncbi:YoaK family protein [Paludibacterium denitrificans]|uniref:YoaK family protein n=1 Tax=Paludibacterium denitrificans TaxID=2675226 RepID=UPI0028B146CB|nr:YoaK family protein [Paludibacterium denitrificans]
MFYRRGHALDRLIIWARRQRLRGGYGVSMMEESLWLLLFGLLGAGLTLHKGLFTPVTVMLLCFIMGMHNTVVTKLSGGLLRTTHMTGTATDIGIELAKASYYNRSHSHKVRDIRVNRRKLRILSLILVSFFLGGVVGALGFKHLGYSFTVPLATFLFLLGLRPIWYDIKLRFRWWRLASAGLKGATGVFGQPCCRRGACVRAEGVWSPRASAG